MHQIPSGIGRFFFFFFFILRACGEPSLASFSSAVPTTQLPRSPSAAGLFPVASDAAAASYVRLNNRHRWCVCVRPDDFGNDDDYDDDGGRRRAVIRLNDCRGRDPALRFDRGSRRRADRRHRLPAVLAIESLSSAFGQQTDGVARCFR